MHFGKQNTYKEFLYSKPMIIFLVLLALLLVTSVFERFGIERQMAQRRMESEEELQLQKQRRLELEQRVEYLEGQRGIEEELRKNFDVAKEGEQIIILVGDDENPIEKQQKEDSVYPWYQFWR